MEIRNIVRDRVFQLFQEAKQEVQSKWMNVDNIIFNNQYKVLTAFTSLNISDYHLQGSTGYGYGDLGRENLEKIYANVFGGEDALVRSQIVSGTHAIALGIYACVQSGDKIVSATGTPYDTLLKVIGDNDKPGTLKALGVEYEEIGLKEDGYIDTDAVLNAIDSKTTLILIQRSKGYQWRPSFTIAEIEALINAIKDKYPTINCLVDNCYGEFIEEREPGEVGADLVAGSLIKNPGGGLAPIGGYLVGKSELIKNASYRLTAPGIGRDVGASLGFNQPAFQGLFLAPSVAGSALKGSILTASIFNKLGFEVLPSWDAPRTDIIQAIKLNKPEAMIALCHGLQMASPIDSHVKPEPAFLPGYSDPVIMAGGTFIQGSSIELSADGPLREPYILYIQGGLTLAHIEISILLAVEQLCQQGFITI